MLKLHTYTSPNIVWEEFKIAGPHYSPIICKTKPQFGRRKPFAHQGEEMRSCSGEHMPTKFSPRLVPSNIPLRRWNIPAVPTQARLLHRLQSFSRLYTQRRPRPLPCSYKSSHAATQVEHKRRARLRKPKDCRSALSPPVAAGAMAIGGKEVKDDLEEAPPPVLDEAMRPRRVALFVEPSPFA